MIKRFRSERFIFAIKDNNHHSKILQVIFSKRDGSLFVNFPYFAHSNGLASVVTIAGGASFPSESSLTEGGKVTSQLVKYSHHPNGQTHFSQDGKVLTIIRKQSVRLDQLEGHIFTTQIQGLQGFKNVANRDLRLPNEQKTLLSFKFESSQSVAFKLVGRWFSDEQLEGRTPGHIEGPIMIGEGTNGKNIPGFLIAAPSSYPLSKHLLFVTCEWMSKISNEDTVLTFAGGFDPPEILHNHNIDTKLLMLSYPALNYAELKERIGSIDFPRTEKAK